MIERKLISWIIPCFNEEEVIIKSLNEIVKVSASITNYQWELVIIDDGSIDKTSELIKEFTNNKFFYIVKVIKIKNEIIAKLDFSNIYKTFGKNVAFFNPFILYH